jgi:hypothetical protein
LKYNKKLLSSIKFSASHSIVPKLYHFILNQILIAYFV